VFGEAPIEFRSVLLGKRQRSLPRRGVEAFPEHEGQLCTLTRGQPQKLVDGFTTHIHDCATWPPAPQRNRTACESSVDRGASSRIARLALFGLLRARVLLATVSVSARLTPPPGVTATALPNGLPDGVHEALGREVLGSGGAPAGTLSGFVLDFAGPESKLGTCGVGRLPLALAARVTPGRRRRLAVSLAEVFAALHPELDLRAHRRTRFGESRLREHLARP
jgi:hypothetical protein